MWRKSDMKNNFLKNSDFVAGIFGVIAAIAIVFEMSLAGFDKASVADGVKDLAGTLVTIVLMLTAIHELRPIKHKESFEERFANSLEKFINDNSRMLYRNESPDFFEIYLQSDFNAYFSNRTSLKPGWFLRMPVLNETEYNKPDVKLSFHLNQGTFFGHDKPTDEKDAYRNIGEKIRLLIAQKYGENELKCEYNNSKYQIDVTLKFKVVTDEDISKVTELIDTVYKAYLVLGDAGVKEEIKQ